MAALDQIGRQPQATQQFLACGRPHALQPQRFATRMLLRLLQQGRQYAAAGNYPLATSSLERALRINPNDADIWYELGRVKLGQGDYAQAQNMARRALALAGGDPQQRARCEALIAEAGRR